MDRSHNQYRQDADQRPPFTVAAEGPTLVSNNWSLTPSELGARDQFRLLFLSSTTRNATSSDIEDYNTFIQNRAAAGHTDIQAYSNGFKVVGCTEDDDARDNTGTTFTSSDKGVPIYWLGGSQGRRPIPGLLRRRLGQRVQYPRQKRAGHQQHQYQPVGESPLDRLRGQWH